MTQAYLQGTWQHDQWPRLHSFNTVMFWLNQNVLHMVQSRHSYSPLLSLIGCLRGSPRQVTIIKKEEVNTCNSHVLSSRIKQQEGKQSHILSSHLCYSAAISQHWQAILFFPPVSVIVPKANCSEHSLVPTITCKGGMPPQVSPSPPANPSACQRDLPGLTCNQAARAPRRGQREIKSGE